MYDEKAVKALAAFFMPSLLIHCEVFFFLCVLTLPFFHYFCYILRQTKLGV